MKTVKEIRLKRLVITNEPIIYYWWFKKSCYDRLFELLRSEMDFQKITEKEIDNEVYGLLYIGKGKNGHKRLVDYHIYDRQNFHSTGVTNGRLSSLRQTLCGLLKYPMSCSKDSINDFIDENCIVDFRTEPNLSPQIEKEEIKRHYLPLNYQHTVGILTTKHRQILSQCKKAMKK